MKYTYKFVNGESVSVEVSKGMLAVLQDEDRLESNNEQTNSRRLGHLVRLDIPGSNGKCMKIVDPYPLIPQKEKSDWRARSVNCRTTNTAWCRRFISRASASWNTCDGKGFLSW